MFVELTLHGVIHTHTYMVHVNTQWPTHAAGTWSVQSTNRRNMASALYTPTQTRQNGECLPYLEQCLPYLELTLGLHTKYHMWPEKPNWDVKHGTHKDTLTNTLTNTLGLIPLYMYTIDVQATHLHHTLWQKIIFCITSYERMFACSKTETWQVWCNICTHTHTPWHMSS